MTLEWRFEGATCAPCISRTAHTMAQRAQLINLYRVGAHAETHVQKNCTQYTRTRTRAPTTARGCSLQHVGDPFYQHWSQLFCVCVCVHAHTNAHTPRCTHHARSTSTFAAASTLTTITCSLFFDYTKRSSLHK